MAFGSNSGKVTIEVDVDATGATAGLKNVDDSLKKVEAETKRASTAMDHFKGALAANFVANGLRDFVGLLGQLPDAIKEGSRIDDISASFDKLSNSAGIAGSALVNQLGSATGNTIDKLTLMQESVELLNAGLRPDQILAATNAARSYADTVGIDTREALDKMNNSLLRGSDTLLKRIGIQVDLEGAQRKYAQSIGVTREALSEEAIVMVNQQAIADALTGVHGKLGDVSNDAGDNIEVMETALANAGNEALQSIATNEALNEVLSDIAGVVRDFDFGPYIRGLSAAVSFTSNLIGVTAEAIGYIEQFAEAVIGTGADLLGVQRNHVELLDGVAKAQDTVTAGAGKETAASKARRAEIERNVKARQAEINALKNKDKALKDSAQAEKKLAEDLKRIKEALDRQFDNNGPIDRLSKKFQYLYQNDVPNLEERIREMGATFVKSGGDISVFLGALKEAEDLMGQASDSAASLAASNAKSKGYDRESGSIFGNAGVDVAGIFGGAQTDEGMESAAAAGEIVGQEFVNILTATIQGGASKEQIGAAVGSGVGAGIGAALGGPAGAQLGSQLGGAIGEVMSTAFDGKNAGAKARKEADKYFADIFDVNRLSVVVGGQVKQIKDLVFNGSSFNEGGTGFDIFSALPGEAQTAFAGVGLAFESMLGVSEDIMGQISAVIANNITDGSQSAGEALNNLQLFVAATGESFEDLGNAILQSMLNGVYGAEEAQKALMALEQIMTKGIPGAIGAIDTAFENFAAAGDKGGRALLDAIGDVGAEAQELGIKTFPELANRLVNVFGFGAAQVQQFFAAAAAAGINTVADLANATQEQLLAIAANVNALASGQAATYTPVTITAPKISTPKSSGGSRGSSKADDAKRAKEQRLKDIAELFKSSEQYADLLDRLDEGSITSAVATEELRKVYSASVKATDDLKKAQDKLNKELQRGGKVTAETAAQFEKAKAAVDKIKDSQSDLNKVSVNSKFLDFALQFKGNIDLIQIAAQAAGQTFKDMEQSAVDAFLAGTTTFTQAKKALDDSGQGIAGKEGAANDALTNLIKAGRSGGRFSLDALRDIAAEAQEVNAEGFDGLTELLLGQGANKDTVQKLFIELANQGISSLDQLAKVSDQTGIRILAGLDQIKFPFEETNSEITALLKQITDIPKAKEIKITLDVDAKYGAGTKAILERAGIDLSNYGKDSPGIKRRGA